MKLILRTCNVFFLFPLFLLPLACSGEPEAVPSLTMEELANAEYSGLSFGSRTVTLTNGVWEAGPYADGGTSRNRVMLVEGLVVRADFDSSGSEEAVVFLTESTGGTGGFVYMAVVERKDGKPRNRGTVLIGDRVQIRNVRVDGWSIFLDLVEIGPDDTGCCPGQLTTKSWDVLPRGLFPNLMNVTGRLSLSAIGGQEWILERRGTDDDAPDSILITLSYADGSFSGRSGCNRYTASVSAGKLPGDIAVGPAAGTGIACPDPVAAVEARFLAGLQSATKFGFHLGRLALTTEEDGTTRLYLFRKGME